MRRNTDAEKYGTQGNLSLFLLVLYNQLIIALGKLIVLQGSWFTTIGIIERCIERYRGVARNGTGTLTGCRRVHLPVAWALSRDQVMAPPTLITPPLLLLLLFFSSPLPLSSYSSSLFFCSLL